MYPSDTTIEIRYSDLYNTHDKIAFAISAYFSLWDMEEYAKELGIDTDNIEKRPMDIVTIVENYQSENGELKIRVDLYDSRFEFRFV